MLVSMPEIMLELIALILQGVKGLVFDFPACPPAAHDGIRIIGGDDKVGNPGEMPSFLLANFPVLVNLLNKAETAVNLHA